jgi:hypothetical protein
MFGAALMAGSDNLLGLNEGEPGLDVTEAVEGYAASLTESAASGRAGQISALLSSACDSKLLKSEQLRILTDQKPVTGDEDKLGTKC